MQFFSDLIAQSILYAFHFTLNAEVGSRLKLWMPGNKHKYLLQAFSLIIAFFTFPCCTGFYLPVVFSGNFIWVFWVIQIDIYGKSWRYISLCSCLNTNKIIFSSLWQISVPNLCESYTSLHPYTSKHFVYNYFQVQRDYITDAPAF